MYSSAEVYHTADSSVKVALPYYFQFSGLDVVALPRGACRADEKWQGSERGGYFRVARIFTILNSSMTSSNRLRILS